MSKKEKKKKTKKAKKVKLKAVKEKKINHNIKLRIAKSVDFLELDRYRNKGGKKIRVWKTTFGIPYWLFNSKNEIENKNYILSENTDMEDFKIYLMNEQILVLTSKFD